MAHLPNSKAAILDLRKIEGYCLNPLHPRGPHKARVFREALRIDQTDAEWLRDALISGVQEHEATELGQDTLGSRWRVDVAVARQNRHIVVRTVWIVRTGEQAPRFVTCWVL
jgi:hypothetical protein